MPKISLSGPAELLTVIPFHLGFQPVRSVVVVCFHGKRLGLVARLDLVEDDVITDAAAQTVPTLLQGSPSSVALVGFEDVRDESLPLLEALGTCIESSRVVVRERLAVHDGRWRSVGCDCCPGEGWPLPEQADVPAVASYVALGHAVLPDREELARQVEPLAASEPRHDLAVVAIEDWQGRYAAAGGSVCEQPDPPAASPRSRRGSRLGVLDGGDPTAQQFLVHDSLVAWAGVLHGEIEGYGIEHWLPSLVGPLRDVRIRDALVGWLCKGTMPADRIPDDVRALLGALLGPELRVAPAGGGPDSADRWTGTEVSARQSGSDVEALQALLLHGTPGPDAASDELPELPEHIGDADEPGRRLFDARRALDALDDPDECYDVHEQDGFGRLEEPPEPEELEPDDSDGAIDWEEWDEAAGPRLLLSRLERVCRLTPAAHATPLLSIVASLAWWCGDGARAGVAVDRALELEPCHRLSVLLRDALDRGVRPRRCA